MLGLKQVVPVDQQLHDGLWVGAQILAEVAFFELDLDEQVLAVGGFEYVVEKAPEELEAVMTEFDFGDL